MMFQRPLENIFASQPAYAGGLFTSEGSPLPYGYQSEHRFQESVIADQRSAVHYGYGPYDGPNRGSDLFAPYEVYHEPPDEYNQGLPEGEAAAGDGGRSDTYAAAPSAHRRSDAEAPYADLIYEALMSVPGHTMILQDIYDWFRENTDKAKGGAKGWQNSIRHNLSMNEGFLKTDQISASSGSKKGCLWSLCGSVIGVGVQSTTRYRKSNHKRSAGRDSAATPRKGPKTKSKRSSQKAASRNQHSSPATYEPAEVPDAEAHIAVADAYQQPLGYPDSAGFDYGGCTSSAMLAPGAGGPRPAGLTIQVPSQDMEWQNMMLAGLDENSTLSVQNSPSEVFMSRSAGSTMTGSPAASLEPLSPMAPELLPRGTMVCTPAVQEHFMFVDSEPSEMERMLLECQPCANGFHALDCSGYECMV